MVVNELQNNWDEQLPHVEFAYNNSVSATTGLVPNEVHIGRLPGLPLTLFKRTRVTGHQSFARHHITSPTATRRPTTSNARTISSVNTIPSQFLAWNAATQPSPAHCARFPNSP